MCFINKSSLESYFNYLYFKKNVIYETTYIYIKTTYITLKNIKFLF